MGPCVCMWRGTPSPCHPDDLPFGTQILLITWVGLCARYSRWPSVCLWLLLFPRSSSSPRCRWLVTDEAVNYSGWACIRKGGDVGVEEHIPTHKNCLSTCETTPHFHTPPPPPPPPPAGYFINQFNFLVAFFLLFFKFFCLQMCSCEQTCSSQRILMPVTTISAAVFGH